MAHAPPEGQPIPAHPAGAYGSGGPGGVHGSGDPNPAGGHGGGPVGATAPGLPGWAKVLVGCAVGCGSLIVLVAIVGAVAAWWAMSTEKQHETLALAGPDVLGVVHIDGAVSDAAVSLLTRAMSEVAREQSGRDGTIFGDFAELWVQLNATQMRQVFPKDVTVVLERGAGSDEAALLVGVNLAQLPRAVRRLLAAVLGDDDVHFVHRGHPVLDTDDGGGLALVDGTILWTSQAGAARGAIDRLLDGTGRPSGATEGAMVWGWLDVEGGPEIVSTLLFALAGARDVPEEVVSEVASRIEGCRRGAFHATPPEDDRLTVRYDLECADIEVLREVASRIDALLEDEVVSRAATVVSRSQSVDGPRLEGEVVYGDLHRTLVTLLSETEQPE
jgi:hypothetical protein